MRVEQLLHGYQDGHGLLAGSLMVRSPKNAARLSIMSDWSGFRDPNNQDHSYITAYPLEDGNYYVIAKSWYAYEMERPGCVWTHSLVVDLKKIDARFDFRMLIQFFHRPEKGSYGQYNKPIEIDTSETFVGKWEGQHIDEVSIMFVLSSLAKKSEPFDFKIELNSLWYQQFCLTYLQYLTTEMLSHVSVSSGGAVLRRLGKDYLTMQFVTDRGAMSLLSPPWAEKLKKTDFNNGLLFFANSLDNDRHDVPVLIRVFGNEVGDDIERYYTLGRLLDVLYQGAMRKEQTGNYSEVINLLISAFPNSEDGSLIKQNFLANRISSLYCNDDELLFEIATISGAPKAFSNAHINISERTNGVIENDKRSYLELIKKLSSSDSINEIGQFILSECFNNLNSDDLSALGMEIWNNIHDYAYQNENYLLSDKWLKLDGKRFTDIFFLFRFPGYEKYQYWTELFERVLHLNIEIPDYFIEEFFKRIPNIEQFIYNRMNVADGGSIHRVLYQKAIQNVPELLVWLVNNKTIQFAMEDYIVRYVDIEDRRIYQSDQDLWGWLLSNDTGQKSIDYYLFEFELAMKWDNLYALPYLTNSFYHIHESQKGNSADYRIWCRVSKYGGKVGIMDYWDRCKKLRVGIVKHIKELGVNKTVFMGFTPDLALNMELYSLYDKV